MAVIDISEHMVPSRYGDSDQWVTADQFNLPIPATSSPYDPDWAESWIELRMHSRYIGRTLNFSVLYQGPGGEMRIVAGSPQEVGPLGKLIPRATMIAKTPVARARVIEVQAGDVLVINGQRMVIRDDRMHDYPRLVAEAESGVLDAAALIRKQLMDHRIDLQSPEYLRLEGLYDQTMGLIPGIRKAAAQQ